MRIHKQGSEHVPRNKRTRTLESVEEWGQIYLEHAHSTLEADDIEALERFGVELRDFVDGVRNRWMGKRQLRRLTRDRQDWLRGLHHKLVDLEMEVASRIIEVRRDKELLIEMESLAFPEEIGEGGTRELSSWNKSPLYFPDNLLSKLASAAVPRGR